MTSGVGYFMLITIAVQRIGAATDGAAWLGLFAMAVATGIGSAWISAWLWNIASRLLPMALAGQLIVSETLFALLYAFLLDGRWPQAHEAAAIALVIAGVMLGVRRLSVRSG